MHAEQDEDADGGMPLMDAMPPIIPLMQPMQEAGSEPAMHAEQADIVELEHMPEAIPEADELEPPIIPEVEEVAPPGAEEVIPPAEELLPLGVEELEPPIMPEEEPVLPGEELEPPAIDELEPPAMEELAPPEAEELEPPAHIWLIPCMHCIHAGEVIVAFMPAMEPVLPDIIPDAEELPPIMPEAIPEADALPPAMLPAEPLPDELIFEPPPVMPPIAPPTIPDEEGLPPSMLMMHCMHAAEVDSELAPPAEQPEPEPEVELELPPLDEEETFLLLPSGLRRTTLLIAGVDAEALAEALPAAGGAGVEAFAAGEAGAGEVGAGGAGAEALPAVPDAEVPPDSIFFSRADQVVAACGQPTPVPFKFWSVTVAALRRASCDAVLSSVGKVTLTEGLCTA